jgi:hypothetical protein
MGARLGHDHHLFGSLPGHEATGGIDGGAPAVTGSLAHITRGADVK